MLFTVCLLYFIYLLEGEGAGGRVCACCTLLLQRPGANLNTVKRIVTLHWNQTNLIYVNIHLKKINLKIPCTSVLTDSQA